MFLTVKYQPWFSFRLVPMRFVPIGDPLHMKRNLEIDICNRKQNAILYTIKTKFHFSGFHEIFMWRNCRSLSARGSRQPIRQSLGTSASRQLILQTFQGERLHSHGEAETTEGYWCSACVWPLGFRSVNFCSFSAMLWVLRPSPGQRKS